MQTPTHNNNDDDDEKNHHEIDRRHAILALSTIATSTLLSPPPASASATTTTGTNSIPEWTLPNNVQFPLLALNTVGLTTPATELALGYAVRSGITHVDFHPGRERDGVALYLSHHPTQRKNLFLNTKIRKAPPGTSPADAARATYFQIEEDLKILSVKNVDMLMLRDSPDPLVIQAQWAVLEEALASGKTRSIGVINFCEGALTAVLEKAKVVPSVNYYMLHVGMGRDPRGLRSFTESRGIRTFAYGAVGEPGPNAALLDDPTVVNIGVKHGKDPEEVALRWVTQSGAGVSVRPTTNYGLGTSVCEGGSAVCRNGIEKRAASFGWELTREEMGALDALTSPDDNPTLFSSRGCPDAFVMPK